MGSVGFERFYKVGPVIFNRIDLIFHDICCSK